MYYTPRYRKMQLMGTSVCVYFGYKEVYLKAYIESTRFTPQPSDPTVWYSADGSGHTQPPSTRIAQTARTTTPGRVGRIRTCDLTITSTALCHPSRGANPQSN